MPKQSAAALARSLDLLVALAVLTATAPVWLGIALALWLEGPGPLLVGGGRLRFRTVRLDATGRVIGRGELGHYLYIARLDELPQFLSLLKGDLTLFGADAPALSLGA